MKDATQPSYIWQIQLCFINTSFCNRTESCRSLGWGSYYKLGGSHTDKRGSLTMMVESTIIIGGKPCSLAHWHCQQRGALRRVTYGASLSRLHGTYALDHKPFNWWAPFSQSRPVVFRRRCSLRWSNISQQWKLLTYSQERFFFFNSPHTNHAVIL